MNITEGLRPTPIDERDFKLGAAFGHAVLSGLPDEYQVGEPLVIKDQGPGTDMCTAYALTAVSEDQEGVVLDPFYTFGKTKQITNDPAAWGADLRSACKSGVSDPKRGGGFLEIKDITTVVAPANQTLRDEAADWKRITKDQDFWAKKHAKKSYFSVEGPYDTFDNMRSAMWQLRSEKRSVFTGCEWRKSWTTGGGTIFVANREQSFGHAVKAYGWEDDFMKLQLSNGVGIGDGGKFKIHRNAVNTAFTFGAYTLLDMPREDAEYCVAKAASSNIFFPIFYKFNKLFS